MIKKDKKNCSKCFLAKNNSYTLGIDINIYLI